MIKYKRYLIGIIFSLITSSAFASLPTVETYYQHTEKTTEYIVEKDDDLDYTQNKYYIRADEDLSKRLAVMLNYVNYTRTYKDEDDLNNRVQDIKNNWDYYFYKESAGSLKLDVNLAYKTKRYNDNETQDFNRTKASAQLTWDKDADWRIALKGGAEWYDFINSDEKKKNLYYEKITAKKYFNDEKIVLIGGAKLKQSEINLKNHKNEYELDAGVDVKTDNPLLEKISLRGEFGARNTVEDEDYAEEELNYDYKYVRASAKTVHQLTEKLETSLRGEIRDKTYEEVDYDYNSYLLGNKWKYKHYLKSKRKKYIQVSLDLVYANTKYKDLEDDSHYKDGAVLELAYKMWGMWSYSVEFGAMQYKYELEEKDRNDYHVGAVLTRGFFDNKFKLNLEYNYRIKDYLSSDRRNVYQNSFLIGGVFKF